MYIEVKAEREGNKIQRSDPAVAIYFTGIREPEAAEGKREKKKNQRQQKINIETKIKIKYNEKTFRNKLSNINCQIRFLRKRNQF